MHSDIQKRIEEVSQQIRTEDDLLNDRTGHFLTTSGILVAAFAFGGTRPVNIALFGTVVAIIWLVCAHQSRQVIALLHRERKRLTSKIREGSDRNGFDTEVYELVEKGLFRFSNGFARPTNLLAWWLPSLFVIGWSVTIALLWRTA